MKSFTIEDVLAATGAKLSGGDAQRVVSGVSTDTRTLSPGDLFFALSGPNFDGNRFATAAADRGAAGLVLEDAGSAPLPASLELPRGTPVLLHPAPRQALSALAAWHRGRLSAPVVGITGSCGKTTTKNVLLELLADRWLAVGSPNSFNNDIGVPHTLFLADETSQAVVVEMGTNHPGEIAALCRTARPTAGIVTCVGASHLEGLGSVDGVAREKAALVQALPADGFCVLNADCQWTVPMLVARRRHDVPAGRARDHLALARTAQRPEPARGPGRLPRARPSDRGRSPRRFAAARVPPPTRAHPGRTSDDHRRLVQREPRVRARERARSRRSSRSFQARPRARRHARARRQRA